MKSSDNFPAKDVAKKPITRVDSNIERISKSDCINISFITMILPKYDVLRLRLQVAWRCIGMRLELDSAFRRHRVFPRVNASGIYVVRALKNEQA